MISGFQRDVVPCTYYGGDQLLLENCREKLGRIQTLRLGKYHMKQELY